MVYVHLSIVLLFVLYFIIHSLTASLRMKKWVSYHWPQFMPFYRLTFNALAILLVLPLLWLLVKFPGEPLWQWTGVGYYISHAVAVVALIGFFVSLKYYDVSEFWGMKQWRNRNLSVHDQETFHLSPFHCYVRHPWYFFLLLLLWTRDVSTTQLTAYLLVTLYIIIGSWFEERKLIAYHGNIYREYQQKVAGLIPLPWKTLTAAQAQALIEKYASDRSRDNA